MSEGVVSRVLTEPRGGVVLRPEGESGAVHPLLGAVAERDLVLVPPDTDG